MQLSKQQLAEWVGVPEERIDELVDAGFVEEQPGALFDPGAVHVSRLMLALVESGVPLSVLRKATEEQAITLRLYPGWFPTQPSGPGRPFSEVLADLSIDARPRP